MRAEGGSPNIINGVSRQPAEVRLTSQLEESVNQFPTVTRGLVPRNPALLKGRINAPLPANSTQHLIDRDDAEQYVVTISPTGVQVHDLQGNAKTVNAPNGYGYLAGALAGDLEAMTVTDHTFILNTKKVVQKLPALSPAYANGGLIHIAQGDYHTEFSVLIDGTVCAKYTTEGGPYGTESDTRSAERGARPAVIAHQLLHGTPPAGMTTLPAAATTNLVTALGAGWTFTLLDNVIYIQRSTAAQFTLNVKAGQETRARGHQGTVQNFSELPKRAPNGFSLKVSGDEDTNYDDYYVRFDHPAGSAQGRWKETVAPGIQYKIDPATMPHLLVREADGTFTFKQGAWGAREVGDDETNPWPSFVGHKVDGLVFFKDRVGLISGEAVAMSRHKDFFNFFIESILAPLDTDPVDVAISFPDISTIHHAVPFAGEMIMFTASVPFRFATGEVLSPKSASFEHVLTNKVSAKVRPVVAGSRLYFVNDAPSGCFVHEFFYDRDVGVKEAPTITDHVNGYIPSGVKMMETDEDLKMLVMVSENDPSTIYVYKWLWVGSDKAQSAWQKWTLMDPIVGLRFYGEELIIVTQRGGGRDILALNCHEAWTDGKAFPAYLDRRVEVLGVYDGGTDRTVFTLPYPAEGVSLMFRDGEDFGFQPPSVEYAGNTVKVPGNFAKWAYAGFEYRSYGELSPLLYRAPKRDGGFGNAEAGVYTTVANVAFETSRSAFLGVDLFRDYRKPHNYAFSAALVGTKTGKVGSVVLGEIKKPVSVMSKAEDFRLQFGNIGPYPYSVMSYKWSGSVNPISY